MTDLTTQLTKLINAATNRPDRPHTAHGNHQFYYDCAICSGKAEEIAAALTPGIQNLIGTAAAEALQAAATAWDQADEDGSIGEFANEHYRAGQNLPSLWLHHRAAELASGGAE